MKIPRKRKIFFIPLFSMSDVAFLLLIFIMLVSLINYRIEVNIDYPITQSASKVTAEKNLEIWIDTEGRIYLDGTPASFFDLEIKIIDLHINAPDTRVHIISDRYTPYNMVNNVLEVLQVLQYRVVSFVVKTNE